MNLTLPTVSVTPGPEYATENNAAFTTIDSHNHTSGQGVQVPTLGININANLSFSTYYATNVGSMRCVNQGSPLGTASDKNCVYFSGGNLYANDSSGNQIQITAGGSVNTAAGNINGMGATTASVTYTVGNTTFTFWSNNNVPAALDIGAVVIRETGATSPNGITLQSPAGLAASYSLTLPTAVAGTNNAIVMSSNAGVLSYLSLGSAGAIARVNSAGTALSYLSMGSAYQVLQVNSGGSDVSYGSVTRNSLASVGQQISSSCETFTTASLVFIDVTNLSVTITTVGRPVIIMLVPKGTSSVGSYFGVVGTTFNEAKIRLTRGGSEIALWYLQSAAPSGTAQLSVPVGMVNFIDPVAAGTYTYKLQAEVLNASTSLSVVDSKLVAYEL